MQAVLAAIKARDQGECVPEQFCFGEGFLDMWKKLQEVMFFLKNLGPI